MTQTLTNPLKLVHLITSLDMGGAEMMLYRLLKHMDRANFKNQVICMIQPGKVGDKIQALGVPVSTLGMTSGSPSLRAFFKLVRILGQERPAILHTWMYHADLLGALAASLTRTPQIWGIHNWSLDPALVKSRTVKVVRINARLSGLIPRRIVFCSDNARIQHLQIGYSAVRSITIPNGFDLQELQPDASARASFRQQVGLSASDFVIGLVARFDPLKDHQNFARAAGLFLQRHPQAHFLLCGRDITWDNPQLSAWLDASAPRSQFHLLGQQEQMRAVMNSLDVNTLSSRGEAFPSVLAEAMACGVPCVATDVGDSAFLMGETGIAVPPNDPRALADGWEKLLEMGVDERRHLGEKARRQVEESFGILQITRRYEDLYQEVAKASQAP